MLAISIGGLLREPRQVLGITISSPRYLSSVGFGNRGEVDFYGHSLDAHATAPLYPSQNAAFASLSVHIARARSPGTARATADAHASETMSDFGPAVPPNFKHRAAASSAPKKVTNTDSDLRGFEASVLQAATPPRQMAGNATGTKVKAATEVREMPEPGPPLGTLPAGTDVVVVMRMGPAVQIAMPICGFIDTAALDE